MYQVDSEDANFLFLEKAESPTHISLICLYDQSSLEGDVVRFTHVRQHIGNRINASPVFSQKIQRTPADIDYPYWVDDEHFDLDFHVRHLALPKPGDWRQFCIQISRLHSRSLDMNRPLWELYVIEGLDNVDELPSNSFALYFKVHHCAMDEFTAMELVRSLHAHSPDKKQHEAAAQHIAHLPATAPRPLEMVLHSAINNSLRSLRLMRQSLSNCRTASKIIARLSIRALQNMAERGTAAPTDTRFSRALSPSRVFEGAFYSRQQVEDYAATVPGATTTHAVLAICSEALRRYLDKHGELDDVTLSALLEVNVRNAGAHALAGNRIAINQIDLHAATPFPVDRLQAIYSANRELHSIDEAELTSFKLHALYENLPAPVLAWLGRTTSLPNSFHYRAMEGVRLGLAQLQGGERPLYLLGARMYGFTSISPLYSGCGLMFSVSTYADVLGLTFTSDRYMMPEPAVMRDCLDEAVRAVERALKSSKRGSRGAAKKSKSTRIRSKRAAT